MVEVVVGLGLDHHVSRGNHVGTADGHNFRIRAYTQAHTERKAKALQSITGLKHGIIIIFTPGNL